MVKVATPSKACFPLIYIFFEDILMSGIDGIRGFLEGCILFLFDVCMYVKYQNLLWYDFARPSIKSTFPNHKRWIRILEIVDNYLDCTFLIVCKWKKILKVGGSDLEIKNKTLKNPNFFSQISKIVLILKEQRRVKSIQSHTKISSLKTSLQHV